MSEHALQPDQSSGLTVRYCNTPMAPEPDANVLAEIVFGTSNAFAPHPRRLHVALEALHGAGLREVWHSNGPVRTGRAGAIRFSEDDRHLLGIIEIDEREHDEIGAATASAYAQIANFQSQSGKPHLLRMWNYFDAITLGDGDAERYKLFCVGRAEGLATRPLRPLPAATAIGRRDGEPVVQIYWLAATEPGRAIENPRQISAYDYPRQYGRASPRFARAMLNAGGELLISGTASIVGHATHHDGDVLAQLEETILNLDALLQQAHARDARCPARFSDLAVLKVYLRHPQACDSVVAELRRRLPARASLLVLAADICRKNLLIEIDGLHL